MTNQTAALDAADVAATVMSVSLAAERFAVVATSAAVSMPAAGEWE